MKEDDKRNCAVRLAMEELLSSENDSIAASGILHILAMGEGTSNIICSNLSTIDLDSDADRSLIMNSIKALGLLGERNSVQFIIPFFREEKTPDDLLFNDHLIEAMIRISDPKGYAYLLDVESNTLSQAPFERIDDRITRIVNDLSSRSVNKKVHEALLAILGNDLNKDIRLKALSIISSLDDPDGLDPLLELLKDSEPAIRREVVKMIFQRRAGEYSEYLRSALDDEDQEVQALAMYGLLLSDRTVSMEDVGIFISKLSKIEPKKSISKEVQSLLSSYMMRYSQEAKPLLYDIIKKGDKGSKELANSLIQKLEN